MRKSLRKKTVWMFVLLLFFFSTTFMIATFIILQKAEDDFKIRTSETAVNNVTSVVQTNLVDYNYISRLLMVNEDVVHFLHASKANADNMYDARMGIYKVLNAYSNIDSVYVYRNDGDYANTGKGTYFINMDSVERDRIINARGSMLVSINGNGTIRKENRTTPFLTVSRAIYDLDNQSLLGYLVMNVSCEAFDGVLDIQNSGGMCIIGSDGTLLCGDERIATLYDNDYSSPNMVYKNIKIDGERQTLTGKLAFAPLVVLCVSGKGSEGVPVDTTYALMIMLVAFILSATVCVWFITINVTRPIRKLGEAMKETRSSGWLKPIDTKMPNSEFEELTRNYNRMIEYLNVLINQIIQNEKTVQKAEMRVLQEQIKPHFLYNSLETISYMAMEANAGKVHDALETLGDFYRNFLSKGDREIPLKRELKITQEYLALQKLRYGDIFEAEYEIDEQTLECMIPKLILQPLVENCIYHGVRLKGEKGIIRITTRMKENGLHILVYDTGIGMSQEQIQKVLEDGEKAEDDMLSGFGLRGTINRIRYYCDCENIVQIRSEPSEYTEIELFLPNTKKSRGDGKCIE